MRADATPGLIGLRRLLAVGRPPSTLVAFGAAGERTWSDFSADVANLAQALRRAGVGDWLLYSEDSYAFAVSLLAIAYAGCAAILPPNHQPGTLGRLARLAAGALVDPGQDIDDPKPARVLHPLAAAAGAPPLRGEADGESLLARFFTSGTTGEGTAIAKRLRHLDDEVAVLERQFGTALAAGARLYATVSHQHIYGALFRVLWPLAAGRAFCRDTFLYAEEILPRLAVGSSALVTTPTHLRTMVESGASRELPRGIPIFTSGGPLPPEVAAAVSAAVGAPAFEILGSTETGGVAWRRRPRGGDTLWTVFEEVEVDADADGRLVVTSPFASVGEATGDPRRLRFTMGDIVEIAAGGFHLRGRADRVVKIGARRLSLPEMEGRLLEHPWVDEAALLAMQRAGEARVCAVLVLSAAGRAALAERGRRDLGHALAEHLEPYWDRALLPRAWRYVDDIPRNSQGKLTQESLRALFTEREAVRDPLVLGERRAGDALELRLKVPGDLAYLEGHFPGLPVVAGVVQLRWVVDFAAARLGVAPDVAAIEALKFRAPLTPGREFSLSLQLSAERDKLHFRLFEGERELSSGRLALRGRSSGGSA